VLVWRVVELVSEAVVAVCVLALVSEVVALVSEVDVREVDVRETEVGAVEVVVEPTQMYRKLEATALELPSPLNITKSSSTMNAQPPKFVDCPVKSIVLLSPRFTILAATLKQSKAEATLLSPKSAHSWPGDSSVCGTPGV
jgi:hypothetical protein